MVEFFGGSFADKSKVGSTGEAVFKVTSGPHKGHRLILKTRALPCEQHSVELWCSCKARYESEVANCPGHERPEKGAPALKRLLAVALKSVQVDLDQLANREDLSFS